MPLFRSSRGTAQSVRDSARWTKNVKVTPTTAIATLHINGLAGSGNAKPIDIVPSRAHSIPPSPPSSVVADPLLDVAAVSPISSAEMSDSADSDSDDSDSLLSTPATDIIGLPNTITLHGFLNSVFDDTTTLLQSGVSASLLPGNADIAEEWNGAILQGKDSKMLYVKSKADAELNLREAVVDLLECADEQLDCTGLVIVLDKKDSDLAHVLHSLLYVGGTIVSNSALKLKSDVVLVGLDL